MKKKSGSRIVRVFNRIINIRSWADLDRVKSFTAYLGYGVKRMFVPVQPTKADTETFEEALKTFHVSEEELTVKKKALLRLCVLMVVLAVLILGYGGYQLYHGAYRAAIISLVVMMIALTLAFRYHFWYYQMKTRQLGCSLGQWWRQGVMGVKE